MKIALVHDFLKEYGGAERVLEALHEIYPRAPIYTAFVDPAGLGPHWERIKKWDVRESWVGRFSLLKKLHSPLRFLAPIIWESFNLDKYEIVISSSGWYICRGVITRPETLHICYLHHPPRHLYGYKTSFDWQRYLLIRIYGNLVNHFLRSYDFLAAQRVDFFIANSKETQARIAKFYRRDSKVIYPPVDLPRVHLRAGKGDYFLCVSRLARAKNIDLAIEACSKLRLPLKIVGKGREEGKLKAQSKRLKAKNIEFLGEVSDKELSRVYAGAQALIFPAEDEEFGITPVEAMAAGVPVIAYKSGGVRETVIEGKTGLFFDKLTVESLIQAIKNLSNLEIRKEDCINQAKKFSKERFKREIKNFVNQSLKIHYRKL